MQGRMKYKKPCLISLSSRKLCIFLIVSSSLIYEALSISPFINFSDIDSLRFDESRLTMVPPRASLYTTIDSSTFFFLFLSTSDPFSDSMWEPFLSCCVLFKLSCDFEWSVSSECTSLIIVMALLLSALVTTSTRWVELRWTVGELCSRDSICYLRYWL